LLLLSASGKRHFRCMNLESQGGDDAGRNAYEHASGFHMHNF